MKRRGSAGIRVINLKDDMPAVDQALSRLSNELGRARSEGVEILKVIHGYGSSGQGGAIRLAVQSKLRSMAESGEIQACIFGENWSKSDENTWKLLQAKPELKSDSDLGRRNQGITILSLQRAQNEKRRGR